ncbi:MAG TPA: methyltransferase domain-containing protein [Phycisphaerae bacterium]|nr:methyltransferase domain-containing protein [Phycisphaerae bacterium]HRY70090.1 methyltransferase domain-containing protein [Phycisphaerae bacterium]HSA27366.1 methyltransferase domain-containing protein [Phycisphaerae bacterium]
MNGGRDESKPLKDQYAEIASKGLASSAKSLGYSEEEIRNVPEGAVRMGLGCGNPTALAQLQKGQTVLDLGSGAGLDAFIAAQKVGSEGRVIGVDMTPEMVSKANEFAREGGYTNVEFRVSRIEHLPIGEAAIDVIISNCVINHAPDKPSVFKEAHRVLRRGGLLLVSDLVVEGELPFPESPGLEVWKEWLRVACGRSEYLAAAQEAGFSTITVTEEGPYTGPAVTPALAGKIISLQLRLQK